MGSVSGFGRTFTCENAHGGETVDPARTALLLIEYQNEFTTEGGKLFPACKNVIESTNMLENSAAVVEIARSKGCKIFHIPISFKEDNSDNPNKNLGILKGCASDGLFKEGSWNSEFCEKMTPKDGDIIVKGKRGLNAFPGTNLEELLVEHGITTTVMSGFLADCCVESTMRTAYEKGFNTIVLTDCVATTSAEAQKAATQGTYKMFCSPLSKDEFIKLL